MSINQEELPPYTVANVFKTETTEQHDLKHPTSSPINDTKAYIVTLSHHAPGSCNRDGHILSRQLIKAVQDAVLIPNVINHIQVETLLLDRVLQRFGTAIGQPRACTIVLRVDGDSVQLVCDDSWKAGQRILEARGDARLEFIFVTCLQEEVVVAAPSKKLKKKGRESPPADAANSVLLAYEAKAPKRKKLGADNTCAVQ